MSEVTGTSGVLQSANDAINVVMAAERLTTLLSVIAGTVDLTGFLTLGNIFTAHITGNLVLIAAAAVRGTALNLAQALAIPFFMLAVAGTGLIARISNKQGPALARLLLKVQLILLVAVLGFGVCFKPSTDTHGLIAGTAAMLAVSAMACQFALLRLALPKAVSTAVMTGNLTNAVLSLVDIAWNGRSTAANAERLSSSVRLLAGFFAGCVVAAAAVAYMADWAWSLPVVLAGVAIFRCRDDRLS